MMSTINRLYNVGNPYQGSAKKVLCVCSAGLLRSPTLANVLHRELGYNTRAAGYSSEYALVPVDEVMVAWADEIVCVHFMVYENLKQVVDINNARVIILDIPDTYAYMDETLQQMLLKQYQDHVIMERAKK
jgi:predicted protein tyrosine phosphatase